MIPEHPVTMEEAMRIVKISQDSINTEGIGGAPFVTLAVNPENSFSRIMLDKKCCACAISGNNMVDSGFSSSTLERVFGSVVWIQEHEVLTIEEDKAKFEVPVICSVQTKGFVRFRFSTETYHKKPVIGQSVSLYKKGMVVGSDGYGSRNTVVNVDKDKGLVDVLL